ncbi:protein kinase [Telmatocola sphagniphila]|uniref:Protein kinase n=1 Tax=Telmatocola sphagniphila TaxID=1123043 RepID=A0A8E6B1T3_9BACT|nr:protein kinase [Telmatocola sphagniphila]QVL30298.1 protein kinase [Telmatocola sphagniphila]
MQQDADFRTLDEDAVRKFERSWIQGIIEALEKYLPEANSPLYLPTLEELVLVDMEFRWKRSGQADASCESVEANPKVEDYLHRFPSLNQPLICRRLIHQEYRVRRQFSTRPEFEEYCHRFPDFVSTLQDLASESVLETWVSAHTNQLKSDSPNADSQKLESFGNYEVFEEIGRGGMGVVYRARQLRPNRIVALKMLLRSNRAISDGLDRFRSEAEAVGRLSHPNIVQVFEAGDHDGLPFFTLEYCEGGSLAEKLSGVPQPPLTAASLVVVLAQAIQSAHDRGILHRDLKPANVLFAADGTPKVTDFGLAKLIDQDGGQTHTGTVIGTPSYMAPEQALGEAKRVGPPADIYALGAILYEVLTGRPPFRGATILETLDQVRSREPVSVRELNPAVPKDLETICLKCLNKEPGNRYGSGTELAEDLNRYLSGETIYARPAGRIEKFGRWCRRDPYLAATGAFAIVAMIGAMIASLAYAFEQSRSAKEQKLATESLRQEKQLTEIARERASHFTSLSARLAAERGQSFGEKRDAALALLWYGRSLEMASPDDDDLQWFVRTNLSAWLQQVQPLKANYPHGHKVTLALFSPDGKTVVTGGFDGTARLWQIDTGETIGRMQMQHPIVLASFSSDNKRIVTTGQELVTETGTTQVWDARTGLPIGPLVRHNLLTKAILSPDGRKILFKRQNTKVDWLQCRDVESDQVILDLQDPEITIFDQNFSPDGKRILVTGREGEVRLYDAFSGKLLKNTRPFTKPVSHSVFSGDGKLIICSSIDGTVRLLDALTLEPFGETMVHDFKVLYVFLSPNDNILMTYGLGKVIRLWDAHSGKPFSTASLSLDAPIGLARFSADSKSILTTCTDKTAQIWDPASGERLGPALNFRGQLGDITNYSNSQFRILSFDGSSVQLWELDAREVAGHLPCAEIVEALKYSTDGKIAITAGRSGIQRWNTSTQERIGDPLGYKSGDIVRCLAINPKDNAILAGTSGGEIKCWNLASGQQLNPISSVVNDKTNTMATGKFKHSSPILGLSISPDGRKILTSCQDRSAYLWDKNRPDTPERILSKQGVFGVDFSPDGVTFATAGIDGNAQIWNKHTGEVIGKPLEHGNSVWSCRFSPDGKTLLTTSNSAAYLWKVSNGQSITLSYSGVSVVQEFSPDGRIVLVGSAGGEMFLFEAINGKPIGPVLRHPDRIFSGAFSPDQRILLTGCADQKTRIWEVPHPVEGEVEKVVLWSQILTGCELDNTGEVHILAAEDWESRRKRLVDLGGLLVSLPRNKSAKLDNADFSNPSGIWEGWYKNSLRTSQGMSETKSKIIIRWDGKKGTGDWDGYSIQNMERIKNPDGSPGNEYVWTHSNGGKFYKVSIVPREVHDFQVTSLFIAYKVTDGKGEALYDGQGYFNVTANK